MKRTCMLTQVEFDSANPESRISPQVTDALVLEMKTNHAIRKEVSAALSGDAEFMAAMAESMLSLKASAVGLNTPGTIGEFFLYARDEETTS